MKVSPPNNISKQLDGKLPSPGKTGVDWFLFIYFLKLTKNSPAIEIGVGNGGSLLTMLDINQDVTAVDLWHQNWHKSDVELLLQELNSKVTWIDQDSQKLQASDLRRYGFVHLDAAKGYDEVINDLNLSADVCDGMICVDDYLSSLWPEVTWAVDDWLRHHPDWKRIVVGNHQLFISRNDNNIKELVVKLPMVKRHGTWYISYGPYDKELDPFIDNGKMKFTWHDISTSLDKSGW